MKIKMLAAALAAAAVMAAPAYADGFEIIANGKAVSVDAKIVSDRTMVNVSDLGKLGIDASAADGVWSFEKGGKKISYYEKTEQMTDTYGDAVSVGAKPIMTSNERLVPLRDVANLLEVGVGWDEAARKPVLLDFDGLMSDLRAENEALYNLLTVKMKNQTSGTSTGSLSLGMTVPTFDENDEPDGEVTVNLKLLLASAISDGVAESKITINSFGYSDGVDDFTLEDAEIDGIYDVESETLYLKTDAIEKISEKLGENEHLDALNQTFPANTWYKITLREYIGFLTENVEGIAVSGDLYHTAAAAYGDGICIGDSLRAVFDMPELLNDAESFEFVESTIDTYKALIESGAMKLDAVGDNEYKFIMDYTPDTLFAMMKSVYDAADLSDEELAAIKAELANIKLQMTADISGGIVTKLDLDSDIDVDGFKFAAAADISTDLTAEVKKAELPGAAVDLLPVLELLTDTTTK